MYVQLGVGGGGRGGCVTLVLYLEAQRTCSKYSISGHWAYVCTTRSRRRGKRGRGGEGMRREGGGKEENW